MSMNLKINLLYVSLISRYPLIDENSDVKSSFFYSLFFSNLCLEPPVPTIN